MHIEGGVVHFKGADILDGLPLLDIKPFTAEFDCLEPARSGWYEKVAMATANHKGMRDYESRRFGVYHVR